VTSPSPRCEPYFPSLVSERVSYLGTWVNTYCTGVPGESQIRCDGPGWGGFLASRASEHDLTNNETQEGDG